MLEIDVHGFYLEDAKYEILEKIDECLVIGEETLKVIHGYHTHIIRDYIRSRAFIDFARDNGYEITTLEDTQGTTLILI
ncbi:MAG: Smr/MutS family protein [Promethearchaeota archaeon]